MFRKQFCTHYKDANVKKFTFIDEKPFEIGGVPNKQNTRVYKKQSQRHTIPNIKTEKFNTKIHTFCAINWKGKSKVRFYIKNIKKKKEGKGKKEYI